MNSQERAQYLQRCAAISLQKRWPYAVVAGLLVGLVTFLVEPELLLGSAAGLLASLLTLAGIALDSVRRHAHDL